jgi:hypothetical protein
LHQQQYYHRDNNNIVISDAINQVTIKILTQLSNRKWTTAAGGARAFSPESY